MRKILAVATVVAATCVAVGQEAATRPAGEGSVKVSRVTLANGHTYTISKETTVVDGPRNADGTINYGRIYNARISKGVTPENNAAVLLLRVTQTPEVRPKLLPLLEELNVPAPLEKELIQGFDHYAALSEHPPKQEEIDAMSRAARETPWKTADHPLVAEWLARSEVGAKLLDEASRCSRLYLPFVSNKNPPAMSEGMPSYAGLRVAAQVMASRAMHRAGEGDVRGSLEEIGHLRAFARLSLQLQLAITDLVGLACDDMASHALQGMILDGNMSSDDLAAAKKLIEALPPLTDDIEGQPGCERLFALDVIMQFMRGGGGKFFSYFSGDISGNTVINRGDLDRADWDTMMKEVGQTIERENSESRRPLLERLNRAGRLIEDEKKDMRPVLPLLADPGEPQGAAVVEAYLKRREKESNEEYSRRIERWLQMPSAGMAKGFAFIDSRYGLNHNVCRLLITLQQYQLAHGSYPRALKDLGVPVLQDPFDGQDIHYRQDGDGFVVWGVGNNMKDDGATGDDMVYRGHAKR